MAKTIAITPPFITLGQLLKFQRLIAQGSQASAFLSSYQVLVNNAREVRRGRKLYVGDQIAINDQVYELVPQAHAAETK